MDAGTIHVSDSWLMRLGEHFVRSLAMALVVTGQMLPAGSVSAQEEPLVPTLVAPEPVTDPEQPPEPPLAQVIDTPAAVAEASTAEPQPAEALPEPTPVDTAPAEAASPEPTPAVVPIDEQAIHAVADDVKAAAEGATKAATETEVASEPAIRIAPPDVAIQAENQSDVVVTESRYTFGDWSVVIRPGNIPARPQPYIQEPIHQSGTSVSVPVHVNINNISPPQMPLQWYTPYANAAWGLTPTSAYLFQRPLPFWKTRGDFDQLGPFIPGYRYW